jgi:hypothetical protein
MREELNRPIYLALGSESARINNKRQIAIGRISSIFRLTFNCEYLAKAKALAPRDKIMEPVRTAPLIAITIPTTTTTIENLRI